MKKSTTILAVLVLALAFTGVAFADNSQQGDAEFLNLPDWMGEGTSLECNGEQYGSRAECMAYCECSGCHRTCAGGCCECICM